MPCYQVNLISVQFNVNNKELLFKALEELDIRYEIRNPEFIVTPFFDIDLALGEVKVPSLGLSQVNALKREYSRQAIFAVAKKKRWAIKQQSDKRKLVARRY